MPPPLPLSAAPPSAFALYLRADGTLLVTRGDAAIEVYLTASQLIELGSLAIHIALQQDPGLTELAAQQIFGIATPRPDTPCMKPN